MKSFNLDCITDCCLYRNDIPSELRLIIATYHHIPIADATIKEAVKLWFHIRDTALLKYGHISLWNTSGVTNMSRMFASRRLDDPIEGWDVSHVTDMSSMFSSSPVNQPLNKWNVCNVVDMDGMFMCANRFNQPLNDWNVSNVRNMTFMFCGASSFNQPLDKWNTANVTTFRYQFGNCFAFNQPLNTWNTSNVTNMEFTFSMRLRLISHWTNGMSTMLRQWETCLMVHHLLINP